MPTSRVTVTTLVLLTTGVLVAQRSGSAGARKRESARLRLLPRLLRVLRLRLLRWRVTGPVPRRRCIAGRLGPPGMAVRQMTGRAQPQHLVRREAAVVGGSK